MTMNAGDRVELERLYPQCWGWALCCSDRDPDEAGDVLQSAFERILDGRASFRGGSSLRTWIFGVIRVTARERRRRAAWRWQKEISALALSAPSVAPLQDVDAEASERRARLRTALATLPARQREVLHLVFYEELTVAEAARVMKVSVGSASRHYARGKLRMARILESERLDNVPAQ
jgi:RNA polymerase sigma-70 factor (ECF subfamily)